MKAWVSQLNRLGACREALEWGNQHDTLGDAWAKCERGDHMLWLLGRLSGAPNSASRKQVVLTTCQCGRLSLPYATNQDKPILAHTYEVAEAWARGEAGVTLQMVRDAAANAAAANAAYAARWNCLKECADIVRANHKAPILSNKMEVK